MILPPDSSIKSHNTLYCIKSVGAIILSISAVALIIIGVLSAKPLSFILTGTGLLILSPVIIITIVTLVKKCKNSKQEQISQSQAEAVQAITGQEKKPTICPIFCLEELTADKVDFLSNTFNNSIITDADSIDSLLPTVKGSYKVIFLRHCGGRLDDHYRQAMKICKKVDNNFSIIFLFTSMVGPITVFNAKFESLRTEFEFPNMDIQIYPCKTEAVRENGTTVLKWAPLNPQEVIDGIKQTLSITKT